MRKITGIILCLCIILSGAVSCSVAEDAAEDTLLMEDDPEDANAVLPERKEPPESIKAGDTEETLTEEDSETALEKEEKETDSSEEAEAAETEGSTPQKDAPVTEKAPQGDEGVQASNASQSKPSVPTPADTKPPVTEDTSKKDSALTSGKLYTQNTNRLLVTKGGTYTYSGTIKDNYVTVDAAGENVTLVFNGISIENQNGPCVYIKNADNVEIVLQSGSQNRIIDGASYTLTDEGSYVDGAIFSKADLTVSGSGTLWADGRAKHGIVSKDSLIIRGGVLDIVSRNVGLFGKDSVEILGGDITIASGTDGIRSKNLEDITLGSVNISGGCIDISSGSDGIQASSTLSVRGGLISISSAKSSGDGSCKGLKAGGDIYISGGECYIASRDHGIHSDTLISIDGGLVFALAKGGSNQSFSGTSGIICVKTNMGTLGSEVSVYAKDQLLCTRQAEYDFSVFLFSCPALEKGSAYTVSMGGVTDSVTAE